MCRHLIVVRKLSVEKLQWGLNRALKISGRKCKKLMSHYAGVREKGYNLLNIAQRV